MVKVSCIIALLFVVNPRDSISQKMDFGLPQRMEISSSGEDIMPILSPDGGTLYFSRSIYSGNIGGELSGSDVWESKKNGTTFGKPDNNLPFNSKANNAVVGMSVDGKIIYLIQTSASKRIKGLFFSKSSISGWSKPELIPIPGISTLGHFGAYVSPDFDVIFLSMKGEDSFGEEDLYVTIKHSSGTWSTPKNIGSTINTSGFEISPFLSKDKKRLYFSSNGHPGQGGGDIFYSERSYEQSWETWSVPKNLGTTINTKFFEAYPSLGLDSILFFSSNRAGSKSDLYFSILERNKVVIEENKEQRNYLSYNEISKLNGKPLLQNMDFESTEVELTNEQKKSLIAISDFLAKNKTIRLQLVATRNSITSSIDQSKVRLLNVLEFVRGRGIEGSRVFFGSEIVTDKDSLGIKFKFY